MTDVKRALSLICETQPASCERYTNLDYNPGQLAFTVSRNHARTDLRVATDGLVVRCGPVDQEVGLGPPVFAPLALEAFPLHAVLRRRLAKVGVEDGRVLARVQPALVVAGAKVKLCPWP